MPGLAKNARNPEIVDDELLAAQFVGQDGKPLASLFDFPCHPEVLWEHNPHITADYPGVLRREVEAASGAPCIFFAGGLGGMMTPDVRDHSFEEAEHMGKTLARPGSRRSGRPRVARWRRSACRRRSWMSKLTNILYKLAFRRKLLPDTAQRERGGHDGGQPDQARRSVAGHHSRRVAAEAWIGAQGRPEGSRGARVAGILGLANDELGYILPEEDFRFPLNPFRPGKHYEETNSVSKTHGPILSRRSGNCCSQDRPDRGHVERRRQQSASRSS